MLNLTVKEARALYHAMHHIEGRDSAEIRAELKKYLRERGADNLEPFNDISGHIKLFPSKRRGTYTVLEVCSRIGGHPDTTRRGLTQAISNKALKELALGRDEESEFYDTQKSVGYIMFTDIM